MVSALWNACAAEAQDVESVQQQLKEPGVDLEIKDHTGTTPLIQAVRNGHKDIIKALLAAGADINNASSQGKPETYTTDSEILALLQAKPALAQPTYEGYPQSSDPNTSYDPAAMQHYYYPAPPGHEGHYPPYPYPMMTPVEGQPMPPFPPQDGNSPGGVHNLPPADVARTIPCRYFPVCRYGSSCMFLHPQPAYFSGPPPPAPAHYPPMYPPNPYYMMRPAGFPHPPPPPPPGTASVDPAASPVTGTQPFPPPAPISYPPPPNGAPPFSPATNGTPFPPVNGAPFSNGAPYPPPVNGAPYPPPAANGAPFSPASSGTPYTPATNGTPSPFGPPPFSPGNATPYSSNAPYTPGPVSVPYGYPRPYAEGPKEAPVNGVVNGTAEETQPTPSAGLNGTGNHPNGGFARRNGRGRRESFGAGRQPKPPCLFFPSGRCRNGDDCRFPHVMPEPGAQPTFRYPSNNNGRFNGHRSRQSVSHQDGPPPVHIPPGTKLPFAPGGQPQNSAQRVPSADDFPVLKGGSAAERPTPQPSAGGNGNGNGNGLTAAQVLQAPAPAKKKGDSEVGDLADALSKASLTGSFSKLYIDRYTQVHVNGLPTPAFEAPSSTPEIAAVGA